MRYKINKQLWNIKNVVEHDLFFSTPQIDDKAYLFNVDKNLRFINALDRTNVINWKIQRAIFDKRIFIRNEMLKDGVIYNLSFWFQNINLSNINDINFAINIIVIATTLFEAFVIITLIFKLVIIIVFNVNIVVVIVIVFFLKGLFSSLSHSTLI